MLIKISYIFTESKGNTKERKYCLHMTIQARVDTRPSANPHFFPVFLGSASVKENKGWGHSSLLSVFLDVLSSQWSGSVPELVRKDQADLELSV